MATNRKLRHAVITRGGRTARRCEEETRDVLLSADGESSCIRLFFMISSKGGGKTRIWLDIGSADFADVLAAMAEASRSTALTEMSAVVAKQLGEQRAHDTRTSELARKALVDLARKKFESASGDHGDAAQLVYKQVAKLAKELGEPADNDDE